MKSNYQLPPGVAMRPVPGSPGQDPVNLPTRVPLGVSGNWLSALVAGKQDKLITEAEREHFERLYARVEYLTQELHKIGDLEGNRKRLHEAQARGEPMPDVCVNEGELFNRRYPLESEAINTCTQQHAKLKEIWQRVKPLAAEWIEEADKAEAALFASYGVPCLHLLKEALTAAVKTLDNKPDWHAPAPHPSVALAPLGIVIQPKARKA